MLLFFILKYIRQISTIVDVSHSWCVTSWSSHLLLLTELHRAVWNIFTILAVVCFCFFLLPSPIRNSITDYPGVMLADIDFDDFQWCFGKFYPVHRTTNSLCKIWLYFTSVSLCSMSTINSFCPYPTHHQMKLNVLYSPINVWRPSLFVDWFILL